jgi:flagellar protein FliL
MSDKAEDDNAPKKKKGKGLLVKLLIGLVLIGAGGGGVFMAVEAGMLGTQSAPAKAPEKDEPKLVRKGEKDPYAPKGDGKEGDAAQEVDGEGGSEFKTSYFNFTEDFTSNLKNSTALVQISLACSTRRDGRVLIWLKKHELAIRSAVLVVLADTPEEEVLTPEGKQRLALRLTETINKVLTDTEGFGGVDRVYFKSFLVQ